MAYDAGVELFSITDHDTLAAYDEIGRSDWHGSMRVVSGIELSAQWRGRVVHILGYGFDWEARRLSTGIDSQRRRREERARAIGDRLRRKGIEGSFDAAQRLAGGASIGRPHFARVLVEAGAARSLEEAFSRYLSDRAMAGVPLQWARLDEAVEWIVADGGVAVIAHPTKYQYTHTRLRELLADFAAAGGSGLEVLCGRQPPGAAAEMARLSVRFGLQASAGSDFHEATSWMPQPGVIPLLPQDATPLWRAWRR